MLVMLAHSAATADVGHQANMISRMSAVESCDLAASGLEWDLPTVASLVKLFWSCSSPAALQTLAVLSVVLFGQHSCCTPW
jgi:hypothetical protein